MVGDLVTSAASAALVIATFVWQAAWRGALVLAAAWIATTVTRRQSAALRHVIWASAVSLQLILLVALPKIPQWRVNIGVELPVGLSSVVQASPNETTPAAAHKTIGESLEQIPATAALADNTPAISATSSPALSLVETFNKIHAVQFAALIWLFVALAILAWYASATAAVWRLAWRARRVRDGSWLALTQSVALELEIKRPVTVLVGPPRSIPVTWGVLYPVVLLPADAAEWSPERRRLVLLHELAHVRRFDALTQVVAQATAAICWFNPLVWIAFREMRRERERACDDYVITHGMRASFYVSEIVAMLKHMRTNARPAFAALAMAVPSEFEGRMRDALAAGMSRRRVGLKSAILVFAVASAIAMPLAAFRPIDRVAATRRAAAIPNITADEWACSDSLASPISDGELMHTRIGFGMDTLFEYKRKTGAHCVEGVFRAGARFSAGEADVIALAPGTSALVRERSSGELRELLFTWTQQGKVERAMYVDGAAAPFDRSAAAWLRSILPMLVAESGVAAGTQVDKSLERNGIKGALELVAQVRNSGAKRAYLEALVRDAHLTPSDAGMIATHSAAELSDAGGDLRAVLVALCARSDQSIAPDSTMTEPLLKAIGTIEGEGDRSAAMRACARALRGNSMAKTE